MVDYTFLERRAEQLIQENAQQTQPVFNCSSITPLRKKNVQISTCHVWMIEQDDDKILYSVGTDLAHFELGTLHKTKKTGECLVVRDGGVYHAVEEDTKQIYEFLCSLANDLSRKLRTPVTIYNVDVLDTYRGVLDCPQEEPYILPEQSVVRKHSRSIQSIGDGMIYHN